MNSTEMEMAAPTATIPNHTKSTADSTDNAPEREALSASPASMYQQYLDEGFRLCVITSGKGPTTEGWNRPENAVTDIHQIPDGAGVGILHAYSGTCALDVDNLEHAEMLLACHGINLQELLNAPDSVQIDSGNPGHRKLLYRLPAARSALPSKRFNLVGVAFELRCATVDGLSVQDVLPSAICHPLTHRPYRWQGSWRSIPTIPEAVLALWDSVLQRDAVRTIKTGAPIDASWSEVMGALESIDPDCPREEWLACGMAIHFAAHQQGRADEGYQLWDQWSSRGSKYVGQRDTTYCWRSFHADKPGGITLGTLFKLARDAGWQRPPIDVSGLFKSTSDPTTPISDAPPRPRLPITDLDGFFEDVTLRKEDVDRMENAEFLIDDMVVRGHITAFVAEGGGGKTTIFIHLCEALCASGIRVFYFNVDGNPDDLKRHYKHATEHGYKVITPDARDGRSTNDAHDKLKTLAQSSADLHSTVFIIDTLKKFVDMLAKKEIKAFLMLLRALTTKGATVCLMAHTNKYKDENGSPMYEGTVDLRNDCDDLIYLNHTVDHAAGVQMVTSKPDKVRARFKPRSFKIDLVTREVTDCDEVVPIYSQDYQEILKAVMVAVRGGLSIQKDLVSSVKSSTSHGERKVRNVLAHSSRPGGELVRTTGGNNSQHYAISPGLPPFPQY